MRCNFCKEAGDTTFYKWYKSCPMPILLSLILFTQLRGPEFALGKYCSVFAVENSQDKSGAYYTPEKKNCYSKLTESCREDPRAAFKRILKANIR